MQAKLILFLASYSTSALLVALLFVRNEWLRIGWRSPEIETAPVLDSAAQSLSDNQFTVLVKTEAEEELTQRTFDEAQLRVLQKWQDKFSTFSRAA